MIRRFGSNCKESIRRLSWVLLVVVISSCVFLANARRISAEQAPILINDQVHDFVLSSMGENIPDSFPENDVNGSTKIFSVEDEASLDEEISFSIEGRSHVAFEIEINEKLYDDDFNWGTSDVILEINCPDNSMYSITAKPLMVVELFEPGDYFVELSSELNMIREFSFEVWEMSTPLFGNISYVGPNFDFEEYKSEFREYLENGGNVVVYKNQGVETYFDVEVVDVSVSTDEIVGHKQVIFENYYNDSGRPTHMRSLETDQHAEIPIEFRGVNMVLLFRENSDNGVLFVNPEVFALDEYGLGEILESVSGTLDNSESVISEIFVYGLIFSTMGVLLLFISRIKFMLTKLRRIERLLQGSRLCHAIHANRSKAGFILSFVLVIGFIGTVFLNAAFSDSDVCKNGLGKMNLESFCHGWILLFVTIFVGLLIGIIILFMRTQKCGFVKRGKFWELSVLTRRSLENNLLVKNFFLGFVLSVSIWLSYGFMDDTLRLDWVFFGLACVVIAVLAAVDFIGLTKIHRVALYGLTAVIVVSPFFVVYSSVRLLVGLSTLSTRYEVSTSEDIIQKSDNILDLEIERYSDSLDLVIVPRFYEKTLETKISQKLTSDNPIYFWMNNPSHLGGIKGGFLFFDPDIASFDHKSEVSGLYLYSKSVLNPAEDVDSTLYSSSDVGSYVGLDETICASEVPESANSEFRFRDFYMIPESIDMGVENPHISARVSFREPVVLYTLLRDELELEIRFRDENQHIGEDDFYIKVEDSEGRVVNSMLVKDDGNPLYEEGEIKKLILKEPNISSGLFRIVITPIGYVDSVDNWEGDIVIEELSLNTEKLVVSSFESGRLFFSKGTNLYFYPLESYVIQKSPPSMSKFLACNEGVSEVQFEVGDKILENIDLDCQEAFVDTGYNLYSFTAESYFNPFSFFFSEIHSRDNVIISRSNLKTKKLGNGEYESEVMLMADYAAANEWKFMFSPQKEIENEGVYSIDNIIFSLN